MLAPRKKLWSTPVSAINAAARLTSLTADDILYDVGCGDGRVLVHLASTTPCRRFVGVEIDEERADEARANVARAREVGTIGDGVSVYIRCENALEVDYAEATAVFLYLVPRGLRLIRPLLTKCHGTTGSEGGFEGGDGTHRQQSQKSSSVIKVVTYMAKFENEKYIAKEICEVDHQQGARWPIYLYHLSRGTASEETIK